MITTSKKFKADLLISVADNSKDGAFVRENDTTFMQFDQIVIRPTLNQVDIEFYWQGKHSFTMNSEPIMVGQSLTLTGITGKMAVALV